MKILCLIPARSGSKGIKNKNILNFRGLPMLAWSIKQAQKSIYNKNMKIILSTDSDEYREIGLKYGADVPFLRPKNISGDLSTDFECVEHCVNYLEKEEGYKPDFIIQLRPTYPTREVKILDDCIEKFIENRKEFDSLRTVVPFEKSPYKMYNIIDNKLVPLFNQINIQGLSNTDSKKISNELDYLFYKNILLVEKKEIKKILGKYNIIEEYNIKKIYPSTININIKPTKFVARLSSNDQLVGANGKLIEDKENSEILPYIFGEFNSNNFLNFKKNILRSKFRFNRFKILYFFPSNRWDILTYDDVLIKLPKDNIFKSLNLAYKVINSNDFKNKNLIDLRINKHLVVK